MELHREFIKIRPNARVAVLFIHGIVGTPNHFNIFYPYVPSDWSIYNVLLAGHGKKVEDFTKTSMKDWKHQIHEVLTDLRKSHERIIIVAHSMGTLFAIQETLDDPDKIGGLFLLASPLCVFPRPALIPLALKVVCGKTSETDLRLKEAHEAYGIEPDKHLWKYFRWIPHYVKLIREANGIRKRLREIHVPCSMFQSKNDEVVTPTSGKYIQSNPKIQLYILKHSGHFGLASHDHEFVLAHFRKFCIDHNL